MYDFVTDTGLDEGPSVAKPDSLRLEQRYSSKLSMDSIKNTDMPKSTVGASAASGIRDNYLRGAVGEFLLEKISEGADLSVVSAYFTIYAFGALQNRLAEIDRMRFLFGEPRFIQSLDPQRTDKKAFKIEDEGLQLANRLQQKRLARECAEWIVKKAEIRSVRQTSLMHGKMYHISRNGIDDAILGSSNFTVHGLGLSSTNNNIELNLEVDKRTLGSLFRAVYGAKQVVLNPLGHSIPQPLTKPEIQGAITAIKSLKFG